MKKVISYSLWGSSPQYTINLIKNLDLAKQFFEGWTCRVHLSPNVPQNIVNFINSRDNSEIVLMGEDEGWNGMFWRFYPASDPTVDIMISRDCDSYLNIRDKAAVDEWIASKKMFHIMRDHRSHSAKIMGGMWGAMQGAVPNMKSLIDNYSRKETNNRNRSGRSNESDATNFSGPKDSADILNLIKMRQKIEKPQPTKKELLRFDTS